MKIALVTGSFLPEIGGAEFVVHNLAVQWCNQGHDVQVINCTTNRSTEPDARYSVRRISRVRGGSWFGYHKFPFQFSAVRSIARLLDQYRPDFISAHFGYPIGLWLSKVKPLPRFLITCHGGELVKVEQGYRKVFDIDSLLIDAMNASTGVVAISSYMRREIEELGVEASRILDIPNGVDLDRFKHKIDLDLRSKFSISPDAVVILSIGRQAWPKAYDVGIRAFAKVAAKVPEVRYVMVGRNVNKWQGLVDELGIAGKVIFCGQLHGDEVVSAYQQADILFFPSVCESFGLVVLEAMASGLPVVATNVGLCVDAIETGENGIVVETGQVDQMADALLKLAEDQSLRKRMGAANLGKVKSYSWDRVSRLYLQHA